MIIDVVTVSQTIHYLRQCQRYLSHDPDCVAVGSRPADGRCGCGAEDLNDFLQATREELEAVYR